MARFAPVAPIQVLEGLWAHSPETFGNYRLLLAHHTVAHAKRFSELFRQVSNHHVDLGLPPVTVIMDNSIVELGSAVDTEMISDAVEAISYPGIKVHPVLPDVMGQGHETRFAVNEAYPRWALNMPGDGFMAVCQGENFQDYLTSLNQFADLEEYPLIKILGIPRVLVKTCGTRIRAAISAKEYEEAHQIHFLGFSDSLTDDIDSTRIIDGCGIDSAVPLRVLDVFTEFLDAGKRPGDWFETAQVGARMIDNLGLARQMFGGQ